NGQHSRSIFLRIMTCLNLTYLR
ncbi:unnamed protein product, partial [Rotaria magnacalcarata]